MTKLADQITTSSVLAAYESYRSKMLGQVSYIRPSVIQRICLDLRASKFTTAISASHCYQINGLFSANAGSATVDIHKN